MLFEVCCDTIESCVNAQDGGADRIELCSGLKLGGLTPSVGLVKTVCQLLQRKVAEETGKDGRNRGVNVIKVMVMIRPRPGDFTYSPEEIRSMVMDIEAAASAGADGVVFGVLTTEGVSWKSLGCNIPLLFLGFHLPYFLCILVY